MPADEQITHRSRRRVVCSSLRHRGRMRRGHEHQRRRHARVVFGRQRGQGRGGRWRHERGRGRLDDGGRRRRDGWRRGRGAGRRRGSIRSGRRHGRRDGRERRQGRLRRCGGWRRERGRWRRWRRERGWRRRERGWWRRERGRRERGSGSGGLGRRRLARLPREATGAHEDDLGALAARSEDLHPCVDRRGRRHGDLVRSVQLEARLHLSAVPPDEAHLRDARRGRAPGHQAVCRREGRSPFLEPETRRRRRRVRRGAALHRQGQRRAASARRSRPPWLRAQGGQRHARARPGRHAGRAHGGRVRTHCWAAPGEGRHREGAAHAEEHGDLRALRERAGRWDVRRGGGRRAEHHAVLSTRRRVPGADGRCLDELRQRHRRDDDVRAQPGGLQHHVQDARAHGARRHREVMVVCLAR